MVGKDVAREVAKWKNFMDGKSEEFNVWHSKDHPEQADALPRGFKNRMPLSWKASPEILSAVQLHLQTRTYVDDGMQAGNVASVNIEDVRNQEMTAWRTYKSSTDDGDQHYRSRPDGTWGEHLRDASWASVSRIRLLYGAKHVYDGIVSDHVILSTVYSVRRQKLSYYQEKGGISTRKAVGTDPRVPGVSMARRRRERCCCEGIQDSQLVHSSKGSPQRAVRRRWEEASSPRHHSAQLCSRKNSSPTIPGQKAGQGEVDFVRSVDGQAKGITTTYSADTVQQIDRRYTVYTSRLL